MTLPNDLLAVEQAHIEQFVADQTREGPHLDFKRDLPTAWNDAAKHEFLADATAFANSGGGDLVFGVEEDGQAQALAVIPQVIANVDQEIWASPAIPDTFDRWDDAIGGVRWKDGRSVRNSSVRR